jgi:peroxiredoxin
MPETHSLMLGIGTQMPDFSLPDAGGHLCSPSERKNGYLVIFICNHCPFVIHVAETLNEIAQRCRTFEVELICINANDAITYPADAPIKMVETAAEYDWTFSYLVDENQEVAKAFCATCTPDAFLYDKNRSLFYRGQLDDSRPSQGVSDGSNMLAALDDLQCGKPPPKNQKPAIGCNIKWKS